MKYILLSITLLFLAIKDGHAKPSPNIKNTDIEERIVAGFRQGRAMTIFEVPYEEVAGHDRVIILRYTSPDGQIFEGRAIISNTLLSFTMLTLTEASMDLYTEGTQSE